MTYKNSRVFAYEVFRGFKLAVAVGDVCVIPSSLLSTTIAKLVLI